MTQAVEKTVENVQKYLWVPDPNDPTDPRNKELIRPADNDPQGSDLRTPINSSQIVRTFINNLPAYRRGLSPQRRGLEVGLAHGYWLIGPFYALGPLRATSAAPLAGLLSAIGLIVISTIGISLYAASNPPAPVPSVGAPNPPEALKRPEGWDDYATGFFIGGVGGAFLAYFLLQNFDAVKTILSMPGA
ncbi:MAG: photosystem I reaction center subunit XI [Cyanosarcina radialis HA8281-LM2]|jgi:photosystem I subunit 11|nr:photosystem I reaction center subunit XI [Cyanosarcina radialis HA8281-LM2]